MKTVNQPLNYVNRGRCFDELNTLGGKKKKKKKKKNY